MCFADKPVYKISLKRNIIYLCGDEAWRVGQIRWRNSWWISAVLELSRHLSNGLADVHSMLYYIQSPPYYQLQTKLSVQNISKLIRD